MDTTERSVEETKRLLLKLTRSYVTEATILCSEGNLCICAERLVAEMTTPFFELRVTISQR